MILHYEVIFYCKKLRFSYVLQNFLFEITIWSWAVENLGSSHHASIVCDARQEQGRKIYLDISKLARSLKKLGIILENKVPPNIKLAKHEYFKSCLSI